ncbi:uroporphyrinogen-III C-methyltransferase [Thiothrix lacustris]|uniref:uroporphyrinogen-III C-methyltransferase n=1 Tax=Thiothrix lacustris TaxID=525917 RepID=UPI00048EBE37|nr:uroporphyrinogen-III C-methyltransferase [Thiothrix lacustris]
MIDKPATHQADNTTFDATVDAVDNLSAEAAKADSPRSASARFALFIAILSLLFTVIGIAAGYKHWQRMNDRARANASEIATLREQLQSVPASDALDTLRKDLEAKTSKTLTANDQMIQEMSRIQNQTRQFADTVASQVEQVTFLQAKMQQSAAPASASEWQIAEVEFLLQLANRQVHLAQNVRTAITALKEADALLAKAGAVNYLPVRQQIAQDISTLEAAPTPDIAGISQRITALTLSLKPLPALNTSSAKAEPLALGEDNIAAEGNSLWADYKRKVANALDEAIIIRQHDKPIQIQLDADTRLNLFHLLQVRMETLRLLVLERDNAGFHTQLGLIRDVISTYYPDDQAKSLLSELEGFDKLELQPAIPDISASLKQLESARQAEVVQQNAVAEDQAKPAEELTDEPIEPSTENAKKEGGKQE